MTNREFYEECAGMGLEDIFFEMNEIEPNEEYLELEEDKTKIDRIITISVETHNKEDSYYTDYKPRQYKTLLTGVEIENILLNKITPKYILNDYCNCSDTYDIDIEDLDRQFSNFGIIPIKSQDIFYIDLDEKYKLGW